MPNITATKQIDDWIDAEAQGRPAVSLPEMALRGKVHFEADTALMATLFGEQLKNLIYDRAQRRFRATRPGAVVLGDEIVDPAEMARRADTLKTKWTGWLEHADKAHIRLTEMNRVQLLTAAVEREGRAEGEYKRATFLRTLADGLRGNQKVSQAFKPAEIEAIWLRIRGPGKATDIDEGKAA